MGRYKNSKQNEFKTSTIPVIMQEPFGDSKHPPFNFAMRPDFGGTGFSFVKEITRDRITYIISNESSHVLLTIPDHKDFLHISVENIGGRRFIEAYYNHLGELTSANLWLRGYCDQEDFLEKANPSDKLMTTYSKLSESKTEIMFEVDISQHNLGLYLCTEDSGSDNIEAITGADREMNSELTFINFHPDEEGEIEPVTFCESVEDNILIFGFQPNEQTVVRDSISTFVNPEKLFGLATPGDVQKFINRVFLQY